MCWSSTILINSASGTFVSSSSASAIWLKCHVTDQGALDWLAGSRESTEWLLPGDVARTVLFLAALPPRVNLQQVTIMPTGQAS
ncbi:hypothetical protein QOZ89_09065 [Pseudofrankia sp. BMG5.37]|nr:MULTISPECIES: hypothetical protein [unclassified Pseudofrankia]MDT3439759.1 hypothetical protein [Pseudofrankia sp. BMG5.37]OHV44818.1 hypothetical protein BCD48_24155 [Pseudofrankia sp. BMG5.36]